MTPEFNLSEKECVVESANDDGTGKVNSDWKFMAIPTENVKEFIKKAVDKKRRYLPTNEWVIRVDDLLALAGDKLNK